MIQAKEKHTLLHAVKVLRHLKIIAAGFNVQAPAGLLSVRARVPPPIRGPKTS